MDIFPSFLPPSHNILSNQSTSSQFQLLKMRRQKVFNVQTPPYSNSLPHFAFYCPPSPNDSYPLYILLGVNSAWSPPPPPFFSPLLISSFLPFPLSHSTGFLFQPRLMAEFLFLLIHFFLFLSPFHFVCFFDSS